MKPISVIPESTQVYNIQQFRRDEKFMQAIIELTEHPISEDGKVYIGDVATYTGESTTTISISVRRMSRSNFPYLGYVLTMVPTNKSNPRHTLAIAPVNVSA